MLRIKRRGQDSKHRASKTRHGSTVVEMAFVLPVFFMFMFAIFEFGYAYMVVTSLNSAARRAARWGVGENVTTEQVNSRVLDLLEPTVDTSHVTVYIKEGDLFDDPEVDPTDVDYSSLPDIELDEADPRELFIVRVEVPYDEVAILPPLWVTGVTLKGQSVMRHE